MNRKILLLASVLGLFSSCNKFSSNGTPLYYMTLSDASTWNYKQTNNNNAAVTNSTVTSTSRDSTINGKSYHVFANSTGGNLYFNITGHDYSQYDSLKLANQSVAAERLYLKDDVAMGGTWSQTIMVVLPGYPAIPVTLTNTVTERGVSRTVNGITYPDVIHIQTTLSSSVIPASSLTSNINSYYALYFGLIENTTIVTLNYLGFTQNVNTTTILTSSTLH